jgi:hypothetical protein
MSPWGKIYLARARYEPTWWQPFSTWRMWNGGLDEILAMPEYGPKVERHLDALERELVGDMR